MTPEMVNTISASMQIFALAVDRMLKKIAGENVGFALIVSTNKVAQYASNCKREEMMELLQELLDRQKAFARLHRVSRKIASSDL